MVEGDVLASGVPGFLAKIFASDGKSFQDAAGSMTGMSPEEYAAMMVAGGRSPEGWRSIKEGR